MDKKEYKHNWYLKNKERLKQQRKEYYEYNKQYRKKNKERLKEYSKQYRLKNKEKLLKQNNEYNLKNKEYHKQYKQTKNGKRVNTIASWKYMGLKEYGYTYKEVYEYYLSVNNCEVCNKDITNYKCMDHCHITGCFRWVLCQSCNTYDNWLTKYPLSIYKF